MIPVAVSEREKYLQTSYEEFLKISKQKPIKFMHYMMLLRVQNLMVWEMKLDEDGLSYRGAHFSYIIIVMVMGIFWFEILNSREDQVPACVYYYYFAY